MKSHAPFMEQDVTCSSGLHSMDAISWPDWNQQPSLKLSDYDSNLVYVKTLEHLSDIKMMFYRRQRKKVALNKQQWDQQLFSTFE